MVYMEVEEVFRAIVKAGCGVESDGVVECPAGHFTVVSIPDTGEERDKLWETVFAGNTEAVELHNLEPGYYFVIEDSDGTIDYAICRDKEEACMRFELAQEIYIEWVTETSIL